MGNIIVDRPADLVCRIRINRPDKLNAINHDVREEMTDALRDQLGRSDVRALVFGGVDGNLSAGGDLPSMQGLDPEAARDRLDHVHRVCALVAAADIPVVTAVEGVAAGASVGLALLGDYIIGEEGARLIVPFLKLGLVPDWGIARSLPLRVGLPAARRIMFESATVEAAEAYRIGFFDEMTDRGAAADRAVAKAEELARLPRHAIALLKKRLRDPAPTLADDFVRENADQVACLVHPEFEEGFSAFAEKRRADFTQF